jgi:(p)ppGpp synthase/HD superfamily hydrolase
MMATDKENHECGNSVRRILAAARFAAEKHAQQKRKGENGEPYFNHLVEVAELIAASSPNVDVELVMAAFLHDTVEDTGVTLQELEQRFGKDVADLVAEVTDDKSLPKEVRKQLQVEHTPEKSPRAQTLKLADKDFKSPCHHLKPARGLESGKEAAIFRMGKKGSCRHCLPE